jgi:hypothetical protein
MVPESFIDELIKISGSLPSALLKTRREGFLDPRSDDFNKNQAFGRAVGVAIPTAATAAATSYNKATRKAALPLAALSALSGTAMYHKKLRDYRRSQAKGLNPVTGREHDPEKIERTKKWALAKKRRKHDS